MVAFSTRDRPIENIALPEDRLDAPPNIGKLLVIVDLLRENMLSEAQTETIRQLRAGILALAEQKSAIQYVKVATFKD